MFPYDVNRHNLHDSIWEKFGLKLYKSFYGEDIKVILSKRGSLIDMEDGIDAEVHIDGKIIYVSDRFRPPVTQKGFNLCDLNDVTIRTRSREGKPLEMYNTKATDFIYAVVNRSYSDFHRGYLIDLQMTRKLFIDGAFGNNEIQNEDGNFFIPLDITLLNKLNLIHKIYPIPKTVSLSDWI